MSTLTDTPTMQPSAEAASTEVHPTTAAIARGIGVVVAGPLLLSALEVLGPVSALRRWPTKVPPGRVRTTGRALTALGILAPVVDHALVRPRLRRWGATPEEQRRRLPGDQDTKPLFTTTRGVTIHAPAEEVWRWLVQIGQDRGGFYSYDWLENLAGCDIHSVDEIHEEWQDRVAGDPLTVFQGASTPLLEVDPPHALVIADWGAYVVEPVDEHTCRLLARARVDRNLTGLVYVLAVELAHAIMERRMLLGIKERAERRGVPDRARPCLSGPERA